MSVSPTFRLRRDHNPKIIVLPGKNAILQRLSAQSAILAAEASYDVVGAQCGGRTIMSSGKVRVPNVTVRASGPTRLFAAPV